MTSLSIGRPRLALAAALVLAAALGGCGNKASESGGGGDYPSRNLTLIAPADPGGGWDMTARAFQQAIKDGKLTDKNVEVRNVPGAGGTIGLSRFVSKEKGDSSQLMIMGLVMIGAIETNDSATDLTQVTPIATLTTETEAVVVRAKSKYKTIKDLMADLKKDPGSVSVAGGSAGSTDQLLLGLMAKDVGADPAKTKYVAYSGGGEAKTAMLSGSVAAGITGLGEIADQVEAGKMRLLAVSSDTAQKVAGKTPPTLKDSGYDVEITNWRGVVAAPGIPDADLEGITSFVGKVRGSAGWKAALKKNGWTDFYKTGDDYKTFLDSETTRVKATVDDLGLGK
ncbi:MAG TPA: tripartite tricarboxylate transporter substrate-binding protein [Solirubrobacteraceae bacterium]|nr:tripartite tricarboxylate transporter substrate-binding protein [Solirubrobacteraceae bacterium]